MEISTAQKINRPSDDPFNVENVLRYKTDLARNDQFQTTLRESVEFIETTTLALQNVADILVSAKEDVITGLDDIGVVSDPSYAQTFNGYMKEVLQQSQAKYRDQYVFGGTNTDTKPFELNGLETAVIENANGVSGEVRREVSDNRVEKINISGEEAFNQNIDIFQLLIDIRDGFDTNNKAAVRARIEDLDDALNQVLHASTEAGKKQNRFEVLAARFKFENLQTTSDLSNVQDIDIAETVTRLQAEETALDAALRTIGRLSNPTLLDYV
jgi:flagellar hook-associated protein 3 FlgL